MPFSNEFTPLFTLPSAGTRIVHSPTLPTKRVNHTSTIQTSSTYVKDTCSKTLIVTRQGVKTLTPTLLLDEGSLPTIRRFCRAALSNGDQSVKLYSISHFRQISLHNFCIWTHSATLLPTLLCAHQALELDPRDGHSWLLLARSEEQRGEIEAAKKVFHKVSGVLLGRAAVGELALRFGMFTGSAIAYAECIRLRGNTYWMKRSILGRLLTWFISSLRTASMSALPPCTGDDCRHLTKMKILGGFPGWSIVLLKVSGGAF